MVGAPKTNGWHPENQWLRPRKTRDGARGQKMGSPEPTGGDFVLARQRVGLAVSGHSRRRSPRSWHVVAGCKGREILQRNEDRAPPATGGRFSDIRTIGECSAIRTRQQPPLGIANMPVEDRNSFGSASRHSYGAPANIIGRIDSGWQTISGGLVFEVRFFARWLNITESGPGHGNRKSR